MSVDISLYPTAAPRSSVNRDCLGVRAGIQTAGHGGGVEATGGASQPLKGQNTLG